MSQSEWLNKHGLERYNSKLLEYIQTHDTLYGTCETAAATAAKVVSCANFTDLHKGSSINVKFTNINTAANPTINVNDTGAKSIKTEGTSTPGVLTWKAGAVVNFTFDGTYWQMNGATYNDMVGASTLAAGSHGLVPAPAAGDNAKFLRGDGTWQNTPVEANPIEAATAELNKLKVLDGVYSVGNAHFMPISQDDYDLLTESEQKNGTIYFIYDAPALEVTANPEDDPEEPLVKLSIDGVIYYVPAELPEVDSEDAGKVLMVNNEGNWAKDDLPSELPAVTSADNGNILKVVEGTWAKAAASGGDVVIYKATYNQEGTTRKLYLDNGKKCSDIVADVTAGKVVMISGGTYTFFPTNTYVSPSTGSRFYVFSCITSEIPSGGSQLKPYLFESTILSNNNTTIDITANRLALFSEIPTT